VPLWPSRGASQQQPPPRAARTPVRPSRAASAQQRPLVPGAGLRSRRPRAAPLARPGAARVGNYNPSRRAWLARRASLARLAALSLPRSHCGRAARIGLGRRRRRRRSSSAAATATAAQQHAARSHVLCLCGLSVTPKEALPASQFPPQRVGCGCGHSLPHSSTQQQQHPQRQARPVGSTTRLLAVCLAAALVPHPLVSRQAQLWAGTTRARSSRPPLQAVQSRRPSACCLPLAAEPQRRRHGSALLRLRAPSALQSPVAFPLALSLQCRPQSSQQGRARDVRLAKSRPCCTAANQANIPNRCSCCAAAPRLRWCCCSSNSSSSSRAAQRQQQQQQQQQ
jgi:hypothetical protein